jgi:hypothetical protein
MGKKRHELAIDVLLKQARIVRKRVGDLGPSGIRSVSNRGE